MTPRRFVALAGACGAAFVAIAIVVASGRSEFDWEVARWIHAHRDETAREVFLAIAYLGSVDGIVPIGLVAAAYLQRRGGWRPVGWLAVTAFGTSVLYGVLNVLFRSERPPFPLRTRDEVGWSFPSGHSAQAIAFWLALAVLIGAGRTPRVRRVLYAIAAAIIAATALSRIYLGVHWTFDVLGGLTLGAFWFCIVMSVRATRAR